MKLLLLLTILSLPAMASLNTVIAQTEVTATTTSALALAANPHRNYLLVQNKGGDAVYMKFGSAHVAAEQFISIPAGGNYEMSIMVSPAAVYLDASNTTNACVILEGTNP